MLFQHVFVVRVLLVVAFFCYCCLVASSFCPLVGRFVLWLVVLSPGWPFCLQVGRFVPWLVVLSPGWSFCLQVGRLT